MSSSETNPFSGGRAQMAAVPARKRSDVRGMCFESPPSASSDVVWVCERMFPAPKKSSDLKNEWLSVWSSAPAMPHSATSWFPEDFPRAATPSARRITPMFSIEE